MNNPIYIDVENAYLPNVLPREMDVQNNDPTLPALQAQAVAARTYATWTALNKSYDDPFGFGYINQINNSTDYQVYYPDAYDHFVNPNDPEGVKQMISTAISSTFGEHLTFGDGSAIDAEFGGDIAIQSVDEPSKDYLNTIQDPISTICGAVTNYSGWGMSQKGALRWSKGNQCATGGDANTAWPVTWTDYRQILAHYYIGIDIMGPSGKVAPDDRWNLLKHNVPSQMTGGIAQSVEIWLQNTSATEWNDARLVYQWVGTNNGGEVSLPVMPAGKDEKITVDIIPPASNGIYTLRLDVKRANGAWFSEQTPPWPDAEIPVAITGASATPTPISPPGQTISIPISLGSDDGGTNPGDCVFSNTDNEVYLGACFNGGDITSGFRFQNVPIPPNANIENAYIRFTVDGQYTAPIHVQIDAEASGNPLTYSASCSPRT
ncbi:MAG: hypothetical protein AUJ21_07830 [Anaerolineae bacterium CG1_02_58_13]|nr:MAG: hypothetical protein AUJ21_07830 [Anaerolineae bacterium CG1_02_58_13]